MVLVVTTTTITITTVMATGTTNTTHTLCITNHITVVTGQVAMVQMVAT